MENETSSAGLDPLMHDIFRPHQDPARSIYDAFVAESQHRRHRSVEEWISAERSAVFLESVRQAEKHQLRPPTMEEVMRAERYAMGSCDYGATWIYRIVEAMHRPNPETSPRPTMG